MQRRDEGLNDDTEKTVNIQIMENEVLTELQAFEGKENTVTTKKKPQAAAPVLLTTENLKYYFP